MSKIDDVLYVASSQLGYCADDDPEPGSKFGRWMAELLDEDWLAGPSSEIWWCCIFVSWCLNQAGVECPGFPSYNTNIVIRHAGDAILDNIYDAQPGDVIIFDWDGNGVTDHVGIVEANHGSWLQTIEGNVSNSVMRVTRDWSCVSYIVRPHYEDAQYEPSKCDPDIRFMQLMLNTQLKNRGCPDDQLVEATGIYDWHTTVPLIKMAQEWLLCRYDNSIVCNGDWSMLMVRLLNKYPAQNSCANVLAWVTKAALIGCGYKGAHLDLQNWNYSVALSDAVIEYQHLHGIPATGCVDSDTLFALTHYEE